MANCPKCSSRQAFLKIGFLSKLSDKFRCRKCNSIIEADKTTLTTVGAGIGAATYPTLNWIIYDSGNPLIWLPIYILGTASIVFWLAFNQFKTVKLTLAKDQNQKLTSDWIKERLEKIKLPPPLPPNASRVDYLKRKYYRKSLRELERIANDPNMTKDAHKAATELIQKKNVN